MPVLMPLPMRIATAMLLLGTTLGLGFAVGMRQLADAAERFRKVETVRVKGYAERELTADRAQWTGAMSLNAQSLAEGHALLASQRARVLQRLAELGFAENNYGLGALQVRTIYVRDEHGVEQAEVREYRFYQQVAVDSPQVWAVARLGEALSALVGEGILVASERTDFLCSDLEQHKIDLLTEAGINGRERAAVLAGAGGAQVGAMTSVAQGVFQVVASGSTEVSDDGRYDTSTIAKTMKAVVSLEFALR